MEYLPEPRLASFTILFGALVLAPGLTKSPALVLASHDSNTHILTILAGHGPDNNVEWAGLRHDSRDLLYRTPGGAVPAGTPVTIRFRTFHDDVTSVKLRLYDLNSSAESFHPMTRVASPVSCYQAGLENETCDFWSVTLPNTSPNNLWYRFVVSDGGQTAYYADDSPALDGGVGSPSGTVVDYSYALMVYDPAFTAPAWARQAIIYQIFPDRFRNGRLDNDPHTGAPRYDDPVLKLPWNTRPEGYCRNYADAATSCPWRFDPNPPSWSPAREAPRGRDYSGGDLKGVDQCLDYLQSLGVTAIYFNPIFDSASNHGYDTQDYYKIDPYFGTQKDWDDLVQHTGQRGIRIILDSVFNHMSSDSPLFDRYRYYPDAGACESPSSAYRNWFFFRPPGAAEPSPCAPSAGGNDTYYNGWLGLDSLPVLAKDNPRVQEYFIKGPDSVARRWLLNGAAGWRLDVMGDASFPNGYWEQFRQTVKQTDADALIIGEQWQKDSTLLRALRGDRADSIMNYRLRDAVIGLLAPGPFDAKGFAGSGSPLTPSRFCARLQSIREDYPDAAYYSLMNLLDSHDTERVLWTLTPGAETAAEREANSANVSAGKQRLRLASLIQFAMPGAPTLYYGDEVGMTGDDDPDNRRTYPWADQGGSTDAGLLSHYRTLAMLHRQTSALTNGDFRVLLADDEAETVAIGRRTGTQAALLVLNRGGQARTLAIPVAGYIPDGISFNAIYGVGNSAGSSFPVANSRLLLSLHPLSGLLLVTGTVDLTPPAAPANLHVTNEGDGQASLAWNSVPGAVSYNVYRSPVTAGGWVKANAGPLTGTSFTDTGLLNARAYYYSVRAFDGGGNESGPSNEVRALPH